MSIAANRYAKALLDALYPNAAEVGYDQLEHFRTVLVSQPAGRRFFENPTVPADRRKQLVKELGTLIEFSAPVRNFIDLLIERNRLNLLDEILPAYRKLLDEKTGIIRATVTAARALAPEEKAALAAKLASLTGKQVHMEVDEDLSLIGGVVARIGGTIYDGSIRHQLNKFKARLIEE